jgi:hypothetical protein
MSERAAQLHQTAEAQISELVDLLTAGGTAALGLSSGRAKLGDGTVGALASHTADNYHRIAAFLQATVGGHGGHMPGSHGDGLRAENIDLDELLRRLAGAQDTLALTGHLSDVQLDEVPPASDMRFCDGQRNLEQIVTSLLTHQRHQVDAVKAAVG